MADILLTWNPALAAGDWSIAAGTLAATQAGAQDLQNAVLVSLFTDRVAPADYVFPDGNTDPRGWWADSFNAAPIGSLLWTLARAKKTDTQALLRQAEGFCLDALQWLLDGGVAAAVDVLCTWFQGSALGIAVTITKPSGDVFPFSWTWAGF